MSTDTPKIQYQKEVEVRVESFWETRCMKPQRPKTRIKIENQKRENLVDESTSTEPWRNQSKKVDTFPSPLMNFEWCRGRIRIVISA